MRCDYSAFERAVVVKSVLSKPPIDIAVATNKTASRAVSGEAFKLKRRDFSLWWLLSYARFRGRIRRHA
jgi:hypothetical protein